MAGPWDKPEAAEARLFGQWRAAALAGAVGFGIVPLLANFGITVEQAWRNVLHAVGAPRLPSDADGFIAGRASVIDGDTIDIHGTRVRLSGIDAPESRQSCRNRQGASYACGRRAAFALADRIGGAPLSCAIEDHDRYGRAVATCHLGEIDVNRWMVASGWALAYRQYSTVYVSAEAEAQSARLGVWDGAFTAPWNWRRNDADEGVATNSDAKLRVSQTDDNKCVIKGNVSARGERIFHVPGQQHYSRTMIDAAKGERWFCSEADAIAAGWRASKR